MIARSFPSIVTVPVMRDIFHIDGPHSLADLLLSTLSRNTCFAGRNVQVDVLPDSILLSGVVGSYYQKQLAQESLRPYVGTAQIDNRLEVRSMRLRAI